MALMTVGSTYQRSAQPVRDGYYRRRYLEVSLAFLRLGSDKMLRIDRAIQKCGKQLQAVITDSHSAFNDINQGLTE